MAKSFVARMKEYFGLLPGQDVMKFGREIKVLTYEERVEFDRMLTEQAGLPGDPPVPPVSVAQ